MSARLRSLLLPLTPLYRLALALRERRLASGREPVRRLQFPVISIGNLSTGGAGKTPLTIAFAQALTARGLAVDVLSRGYGRRSTGTPTDRSSSAGWSTQPARVDPNGSADEYGDEPLLIARTANVPVYVAPNRYDAGLRAESEHTSFVTGHDFSRAETASESSPGFSPCRLQLHILDDGFQHRQLHRDLDILLLSRADLNDHLLPAGNLREPLHGAERADVLAIPATDPTLESALRARGLTQPVWRLHRRMEVPPIDNPVLAFCGIARPEQFFSGMRHSTIDIAATRAFPDHHRYTAHDLSRLAKQAQATGATSFLTTEKDAIRLRGLHSLLPVLTVPLRTEIEDAPAALNYLFDRLNITPPPA